LGSVCHNNRTFRSVQGGDAPCTPLSSERAATPLEGPHPPLALRRRSS
jgi:hypothetical protein